MRSELRAWTWWDKLVHTLTGHVSARVYRERMAALAADDLRRMRNAGALPVITTDHGSGSNDSSKGPAAARFAPHD